ncbi:MAG TPA: PEP-CTERM sorting domain-containing protein, partial [Luteolibacter sp.]|nr:PEP-CTERM sorting domain-containing protein [Luteolibacter sp.]
FLASSMSVVDAAAAQWAIWEVVAELSPTKSLADGNVRIAALDAEDAEVALRADYFLANIDSFNAVPMIYLTNPEGQDIATYMVIPGVVPEPATAALFALSGLALFRRRR